jgi:predicted transposase/invertase (TIGR01784 family)
MQNHWHPFYPERAIYYWSLMYQETSRTGEGYNRLSKCIGIHLLNEAFRLSEKLQSTYMRFVKKTARILSDVLELHFFDLTRLPEETKELLQSEIT